MKAKRFYGAIVYLLRINRISTAYLLSIYCISIISLLLIPILTTDAATRINLTKPPNNLGLVGYWTFDGPDIDGSTAKDKSGQANDGTITGAVAGVGRQGQALDFDGTDDNVRVSDNDSLSFGDGSSDSPFTFSAWVKRDTSGDVDTIVSKTRQNTGDAPFEYLFALGSDDILSIVLYDNNGSNQTKISSDSAFAGDTGQWVQYTATYDGSGNSSGLKLYRNGGLLASTDESVGTYVAMENTNGSFRIGEAFPAETGTSYFFDGLIDEVRVYSRALSAQEIRNLYNSGEGRIGGSEESADSEFSEGLVGHWSFDANDLTPNVRDISGQGNHGALQGQTSTTTAIGRVGQALEFDGTNDYVDVGDQAELDFSTSNDFSLSAWVKAAVGVDLQAIVDKRGTGGKGYLLGIRNDGLRAFIKDDPDGDSAETTPVADIDDGRWHHVAATFDRDGDLTTYVDSAQDDTVSITAVDDVSNTNKFIIGKGNVNLTGSAWDAFNGPIDDVRVYDRVLSAGTIKRLYDKTKGDYTNTTNQNVLTNGLVGHWTFDGPDLRPNVRDVSGKANHGALQGQTSTTTAIGRLGQALSFDGTDDYVQAGYAGALDSGLTVVGWMYPTGNGHIVDRGASSNSGFWSFGFQFGNRIRFVKGGSTDLVSRSSAVFSTDEWQHFAVTWNGGTDATNDVTHYRNGSFVEKDLTSNGNGLNSDSGLDFGIGAQLNPQNFFPGTLDDIRVYDRVLSADEIKRLYEMGR